VVVNPDALALSTDGSRLCLAEAGSNDVAVVEVVTGRITGRIPTAWHPTSVAVSARALLVTNGKEGDALQVGVELRVSAWRSAPAQVNLSTHTGEPRRDGRLRQTRVDRARSGLSEFARSSGVWWRSHADPASNQKPLDPRGQQGYGAARR
jgi:hypothetical protein